jgi:hypothetical protein
MSQDALTICEKNLARIFDLLRFETDPDRRKVLRYLAVTEADQYSRLQTRADQAADWVRDGAARIARQRRLIERSRLEGSFGDAAHTLLRNLEELQTLLVKLRAGVGGPETEPSNGPDGEDVDEAAPASRPHLDGDADLA